MLGLRESIVWSSLHLRVMLQCANQLPVLGGEVFTERESQRPGPLFLDSEHTSREALLEEGAALNWSSASCGGFSNSLRSVSHFVFQVQSQWNDVWHQLNVLGGGVRGVKLCRVSLISSPGMSQPPASVHG